MLLCQPCSFGRSGEVAAPSRVTLLCFALAVYRRRQKAAANGSCGSIVPLLQAAPMVSFSSRHGPECTIKGTGFEEVQGMF